MRSIFVFMLTCLLTVLLCAALPLAGEEEIYCGVVRLHVRANSDSTQDQEVKLKVRDAILQVYGEDMLHMQSAEEAKAFWQVREDEVKKIARDCLAHEGMTQSVQVSLKEEYFETRQYGELTLPAGYYTALQVTLGDGEGQNWWCVLYPSLCTEVALGEKVSPETAFADPEYRIISGSPYALKFRTLELLGSLFS